MKLRVAGFEKESIVDGPGIRYVLFLQGCPHRCPGCHNPQTHEMNGGISMTIEEILKDIHSKKYLDGVTFSGGDPFVQPEPLLELAKQLKADGMHLTVYSGFTYEQLQEKGKADKAIQGLLDTVDLLVDGRFILEKKDLALAFRGSSNQRLIDLKKSRESGAVVLFNVSSEDNRVLIQNQ